MSSLPSEIFYNITNFLPNDDITDLMFLSRNFNALVTPRLRKIDQEMATINQHFDSFLPSPAPETDHEWISKLNLKRFEPIGSHAKKLMTKLMNDGFLNCVRYSMGWMGEEERPELLEIAKRRMFLERFGDTTFIRIMGALVATPKFRKKYNVSNRFADSYHCILGFPLLLSTIYPANFDDVRRIWSFYEENKIISKF
ncbi:hypothetical protein Ddc_15158 [Ditylenchus destructor]|nr:hypothetical protein Ddc_15158 [Ditylenchus destructor]